MYDPQYFNLFSYSGCFMRTWRTVSLGSSNSSGSWPLAETTIGRTSNRPPGAFHPSFWHTYEKRNFQENTADPWWRLSEHTGSETIYQPYFLPSATFGYSQRIPYLEAISALRSKWAWLSLSGRSPVFSSRAAGDARCGKRAVISAPESLRYVHPYYFPEISEPVLPVHTW